MNMADKLRPMKFGARMVLDIGANVGESLKLLRPLWPDVPFLCFEPRPTAAAVLRTVAEADGKAEVFEVALANERKEICMWEFDQKGEASSLLEPNYILTQSRPWAKEYHKVTVRAITLDHQMSLLVRNPDDIPSCLFIKVDVQGFEYQVILGGRETFKKALACVIEVCHEEMWKGSSTLGQVQKIMDELGFRYNGPIRMVYNRLKQPSWGDHLWVRR